MKHNIHFQTKGGQYSTDSFEKAVTELYTGQRQKRERAIQMVQDCGTYCKKTYVSLHNYVVLYDAIGLFSWENRGIQEWSGLPLLSVCHILEDTCLPE
jgi:hypothetical protein